MPLLYTTTEQKAVYYWVDQNMACVLTGSTEASILHEVAQTAYDQINHRMRLQACQGGS